MDQNLGVFQTMKQPTSLKKIANGYSCQRLVIKYFESDLNELRLRLKEGKLRGQCS